MIATYIAYQANAGSDEVNARLQKLEAQMQQLQPKPKPKQAVPPAVNKS